jgi:hypothetical protein
MEDEMLLGTTLVLLLLILAVSFLTLSAVGNYVTEARKFRADLLVQLYADLREQQFQHRVTRRVLDEKVLPAVGYRQPEPLEEQAERMVRQLSQHFDNKSRGQG